MAPTLTPMAKKLFSYLALAFGCFVVIRYGLTNTVDDRKSVKNWSSFINDPKLQLRSLIYVLKTYPDETLPEAEDGALLTPYNLGVQEYVTPKEWIARLEKSEKETPLTIFSKSYCPYSKAAKTLIMRYEVSPPPFVIEADLRKDGTLIKSYLTRFTGQGTFPNVIMNGISFGGSDDLKKMHRDGLLKGQLEQVGMTVNGEGGPTY